MNTKNILTHIIRRWNEENISHPKTSDASPPEHVAIKTFSIELKYMLNTNPLYFNHLVISHIMYLTLTLIIIKYKYIPYTTLVL